MNTHTPGPWNLNCLETVRHTIHAHRGHVATVARGTMNEVGPDEIEANARLIAAAPELLAALQLIHANAAESAEWIRARIAPAIAKATGNI